MCKFNSYICVEIQIHDLMKKKLIKISNAVLTLLLSALGFSACGSSTQIDMYGVPSADFVISGKVTDSENNPIKNVQIATVTDTTKTDSEGKYLLEIDRGFPADLKIEFKDIDKEENGSYETKQVVEKFKSSDFVGGEGDCYKGEATRTVDVKLTEKKND